MLKGALRRSITTRRSSWTPIGAGSRPRTDAPVRTSERVDLVSSAPGRAAPCWRSAWRVPAGAWWCWKRARSGIPNTTGSATRPGRGTSTGPRPASLADAIPWMGANNSGRGVGGSMVHYAGYAPRFHPSDFRIHSRGRRRRRLADRLRGAAASLRAARERAPGRGRDWPWGDPHGYPHGPHPIRAPPRLAGAARWHVASTMRVGPVAIANGQFGNRPHCIYRGFCLQGCKVNAKASPLVTHVPDALEHGVEVRADCHGGCDSRSASPGGAIGVTYAHDGCAHMQRAAARRRLPATRSRRHGCC